MTTRSLRRWLVVGFVVLAACADGPDPISPGSEAAFAHAPDPLAAAVRQLAAARGVVALPRAPRVRVPLAKLGQALAFDRILSGNRDISCMTCHLPRLATGDDRSLSVGQGATGTGLDRVHPSGAFIPRNAPPLFNLDVMPALFWDGRVSQDASGAVHTPAGPALTPDMTRVFELGAVSALGLFPVLSREEMRAQSGNELAAIADTEQRAIWDAIMRRLGAIPEYRQLFEDAYPGTRFDDMNFAHASNAIAGFLVDAFSFRRTPWDHFLEGDDKALDATQLAGAQVFMSIRCSLCHNGPAFSDNQFHNVAVAQFGPGEGDGPGGRDDFGRMRVTGLAADQYRFRTTPLRNVELTGPYGHDGAIAGLEEFIDHYSESDVKLRAFDPTRLEPLLQGTLVPNVDAILANRDSIIAGVILPTDIVKGLAAFMTALTDPAARNLRQSVPKRVPSGLPVDR
jgi:cytochrome c peroxidase